MRKVRLTIGSRDIYDVPLHGDDYKKVYQVVGETPMTVIINVRGERRCFNKTEIEYSE